MANVIGPDVSVYEDDPETPQGIDFVKLRASSGYVLVRAGQNLWPDPTFKSNWRDAKKAGLPRGAYWFYDSRVDPKRQAELYASMFEGDFGELPMFLDIEDTYKGQYAGWKKWYDFLERLKQLVKGHEIGIYTAFYYWRDNAPNATLNATSLQYFHQYPLWIASYEVPQPLVAKPWGPNEWIFWQYTESGDGKLYGVETNAIDLNYFNGDLSAFKVRFKLSDQPAPPPEPVPTPPPPAAGSKHKVITTALRVREGPGTNFNAIGMVYFGEIVEELDATNDRSWIKIRNKDGVVGWCSSAYLVRVSGTTPTPTPTPLPEPPPVPADDTKNWYRVNTSALTLRDTPQDNGKVLGYLLKNDTLPALDDTSNAAWAQVRRVDGLTGWVGKSFLVALGAARPANVRQSLFNGVTYLRQELTEPRKNVIHVLAIDLTTSGYEFLVTPSQNPNGIICTRTTSQFLTEFKLNLAINGDGFNYIDTTADPTPYCASGDPVKPNGLAASRGIIYSQVKSPQPTVYISPKNQFSFDGKSKIFNAVSGDRVVVDGGVVAKNLATNVPNPRTALGINKNGRWLILLVVDGRETDYSQGLTLPELANVLITYGVYTGVNMDGGGSSTMVIRGADGTPRVLNAPVDQNVPGKERAVANHLGLFIKT